MTKYEKLREMREKLGANYDEVRNNICLSIAVTHVSNLFNEVFGNEPRNSKIQEVYKTSVKMVYNALKVNTYYHNDSDWTANHVYGMKYLIETVLNDMLGDFTEKDNVNGYTLGYVPMIHAYDDLFVDSAD